jgi:hypothetical protein
MLLTCVGPTEIASTELYDRGCDLVAAAAAIRCTAITPEGAQAAPAVLGCIETALDELIEATAVLQSATEHAAQSIPRRSGDAARDRMHRGFTNLGHGLRDAQLLAAAARALTARALARADVASREVQPGRASDCASDARSGGHPVAPRGDNRPTSWPRRRRSSP